MENYSYSTYADSRDSSPRSSENNNNLSWDDPPPSNLTHNNYKVKFMCSYGGKIQPRNHDNQLTYIAGDTKILAVDRNITFSALSSRLSSLSDLNVSFKYQLPGEDLDALISVTNDEDLHHLMLEYDRLHRVSKPARLRLFLFPLNPPPSTGSASRDLKSDGQWFVDALNSVRIQPDLQHSSPLLPVDAIGSSSNPDFLFGFDKCYHSPAPGSNTAVKDVSAGSDCGYEDRHVIGEQPAVVQSELPRQIRDLQRSSDEMNSKSSVCDSQPPNVTQEIAPPQVAVPLPAPAAYFPERQMISGGFTPATDQSIYLFPTAGGLFHHGYYGMQGSVQHPNAGPVYTTDHQGGYAQVAYDNTGRPVYFTAAPPYQTLAPGPSGGGAGSYNQEGNVIKVCDNK